MSGAFVNSFKQLEHLQQWLQENCVHVFNSDIGNYICFNYAYLSWEMIGLLLVEITDYLAVRLSLL